MKIGRQPRRDAGAAAAQPLPAAPGPATFDAAALSLTVSALPDHDAALRGEFLEVSIPWNRTSAVASQSLGKSSPIIAMTTRERQLEEQLIQA